VSEPEEPKFLPLTPDQAERACAVLRLPPVPARLVYLGCVEGKTADEVAAELGLTADQVWGLVQDLNPDLEQAQDAGGEGGDWARVLLSFFRGGSRDHGPNLAVNRFTGELEEVALRSPILAPEDLRHGNDDDWRTDTDRHAGPLGRAAGGGGRWRFEIVRRVGVVALSC
jgi:hypothetical protein